MNRLFLALVCALLSGCMTPDELPEAQSISAAAERACEDRCPHDFDGVGWACRRSCGRRWRGRVYER
jgi:hypothetical protein